MRKKRVLTGFAVVDLSVCVPSGFGAPERRWQTSLADGMETWQEFGFSVVEAQLTDGTGVH